eukprot:5601439-Pleurochrysis_carterae.AAC.1
MGTADEAVGGRIGPGGGASSPESLPDPAGGGGDATGSGGSLNARVGASRPPAHRRAVVGDAGAGAGGGHSHSTAAGPE